MDLAWYIGMAASVLNTVALFPQVVKGFRTHQVCDLSWGWLEMVFLSTVLWLMYGLMIRDMPLTVVNISTGICYIILLAQKMHFRCR